MQLPSLLKVRSLAADVIRALRTHKFERTPEGIYIAGAKAHIGGVFRHAHCPVGGVFGDFAVTPNLMTTEGLVYVLNSAFGAQAQLTSWYIAPYGGNVSPANTWTAANFAGLATELTDEYTSDNRLAWTTAAPVSAAEIGNSAALAAATMTFGASGPHNVYGAGLISAAAKEATTGKLAAATRFDPVRTGMATGDKLAIEYLLSAADGS